MEKAPRHYRRPGWFTKHVANRLVAWLTRPRSLALDNHLTDAPRQHTGPTLPDRWALLVGVSRYVHLPARFQDLGLGAWTFDNVYFYVYEEAVKLDPAGHDLASRIGEHDYLAPLLAAAGVESRQ